MTMMLLVFFVACDIILLEFIRGDGMKRVVALFLSLVLSTCAFAQVAGAHSGRTDASGGHKDNKNKSGLGSYHYHCGGNPPHLHNGNVCQYKSGRTAATKKPTKAPVERPKATAMPVQAAAYNWQAGPPQDDPLAEGMSYAKTNASGVNVRKEPSSRAGKEATIRNSGTPLVVLETVTGRNDEAWCAVKLQNGVEGYMRRDLLTFIDEAEYLSLI